MNVFYEDSTDEEIIHVAGGVYRGSVYCCEILYMLPRETIKVSLKSHLPYLSLTLILKVL